MTLLATRPPQVEINLLPTEIQSEHKTKRIFQIAVGAGLAVLVILGAITLFQRMQLSNSERALRDEKAKAAQLQTQVAALREFEVLEANLESTRGLLATALAGDVSWTRFLDDLDTNMPNDSWLASVTVAATPGFTPDGQPSLGTANYSAFVTTMPGLAGWLDTMSEVKGLQFVYLGNGSKSGDGGDKKVSFTATAHLTDHMLSGRCQTEDAQCP